MKHQNSSKGNSGMKFKFKKKRKKLRQLIKNEFDQDQNQELGLDKYQEEEPKQYYHESYIQELQVYFQPILQLMVIQVQHTNVEKKNQSIIFFEKN